MNGSRFNYEDYAYEPPVAQVSGDYFLAPMSPAAATTPRLAADIHVAPVEGVLHRPVGELIENSVLSRPVGELIENSVLSRPVGELFSSAGRKRRFAG